MDAREVYIKKFGQFIKKKRIELNLSQQGLADMIGNNYQNVSRLERGEVSPSLYWVECLSKGLGIPLGDLINEFDKFRSGK